MEQHEKAFLGISRFLGNEVDPRHADLLLFTCCLSSGLVDSTIYKGANVVLLFLIEV
jgi:hypothetical protein